MLLHAHVSGCAGNILIEFYLDAFIADRSYSGVSSMVAPEVRGRHFQQARIGARPCRRGVLAYPLTMLAAATAARIIVRPGFAKPAPPPQLIDPDEALNVSSDDRKPEFVLPGISGASRSLADYRGRPVLVHFFATWCEPCGPEMQALERLIARHGNNVVMRIVAISVAEPDGRVQRHFKKFPVSFSILLDRDGAVAKSRNVQTLVIPFLLGTDLTPHFFVEQGLEWDRLDFPKLLKPLKARTPAGAAMPRLRRARPDQTGGQDEHWQTRLAGGGRRHVRSVGRQLARLQLCTRCRAAGRGRADAGISHISAGRSGIGSHRLSRSRQFQVYDHCAVNFRLKLRYMK
ncbi:MAG: TlpA family protein disulfide reductase [Pseudorhodoplanes sp.]|nr:TlpA family protein disulfide reductase [Pseudorhodoplanes sp.]